jgi:SAM-dependent methyltransferase
MKFNFKINSQNIEILVGDSEHFRREFLTQKGYFGLGPNITQEELESRASLDHVDQIQRTIKYIATDKDITIIDIGAGNSIADLVLAKMFNLANFVLLDGNSWAEQQEIRSADFKPYNSWRHLRYTIGINQLDPNRFNLVDLDYAFDQPADLIMSCGAWGFHFPLEKYLDAALNALKPGGILSIAPILNIDNPIETLNSRLTPLDITEINYDTRNAKDLEGFSKYFPEDFSGPRIYTGIWRKD